MKVIFAQGNPGTHYSTTRHNTGFIMLDLFAKSLGEQWTSKKKFNADIIETSIDGEKVLLVKPTTFYNDSGLSARQIIDFYSVDPTHDFLAVHDDLALPLGTIRTRKQGSDAGNNGIKSLNQHIGPDYQRIRVGIWTNLHEHMGDLDFVIGKYSKEELATLTALYPQVETYIRAFLRSGLEHETYKHTA
jgi:PTH1 family peptidyl-tRNA hydrolase